jgi:hypothetical protein
MSVRVRKRKYGDHIDRIIEGTEVEIMNSLWQYVPYGKFELHPVASLAQTEQAIRASMK